MTPATATPPRAAHPAARWLVPAIICAATAGVAALGGMATAPGIQGGWYDSLVKPAWTPPNWLFGPVWTTLYAAMAVAACGVWAARGTIDVRLPLVAYGLQLGLNLLWSVLFFGLRQPAAAVADIVALGCAVAVTAVLFGRVRRWAGWLMLPYLLWVLFAAALNVAIAVTNG